eukprot:SAG11_NODE_11396_length_763_cov_1.549699_1_plen_67_part_00
MEKLEGSIVHDADDACADDIVQREMDPPIHRSEGFNDCVFKQCIIRTTLRNDEGQAMANLMPPTRE